MKKLLIAAALVCSAALSQAAVVNWTIKNVYDEAGTAKITEANGYSMYLFTTQAAALDSWAEITTTGALATQIGKGYALTITSEGQAANSTGVQHTLLTPLILEANKSYDFYVVAFNGSDSYYISTMLADKGISPESSDTTALGFGSQSAYTQKGGTSYTGWTTVGSVPEPTSGLLLLLGVAGLALRRRRA